MSDDIQIDGYEKVDGNPFVSKGVDPDHDLAILYEQSWDTGAPIKVSTPTPDVAVRILTRYAEQTGRGLRKSVGDDNVVFAAQPRRKKAGPAPVEERDETF